MNGPSMEHPRFSRGHPPPAHQRRSACWCYLSVSAALLLLPSSVGCGHEEPPPTPSEEHQPRRGIVHVLSSDGEVRSVSPLMMGLEQAVFLYPCIHPEGLDVVYCVTPSGTGGRKILR